MYWQKYILLVLLNSGRERKNLDKNKVKNSTNYLKKDSRMTEQEKVISSFRTNNHVYEIKTQEGGYKLINRDEIVPNCFYVDGEYKFYTHSSNVNSCIDSYYGEILGE